MSESNNSRQFSAFWPLLILLVTLVTLQAVAIYRTLQQKDLIAANVSQLEKVEDEAKKVDTVLGAFSRDLLTLAEKNTNAQRVVTDFQIRQNPTNVPVAPAN